MNSDLPKNIAHFGYILHLFTLCRTLEPQREFKNARFSMFTAETFQETSTSNLKAALLSWTF